MKPQPKKPLTLKINPEYLQLAEQAAEQDDRRLSDWFRSFLPILADTTGREVRP